MILEVRGIDTYYGLGHILHGLSLGVGEGEVVALLGRNGAGKTTTLRSITGLTPPRSGAITYKGASIAGLPAAHDLPPRHRAGRQTKQMGPYPRSRVTPSAAGGRRAAPGG